MIFQKFYRSSGIIIIDILLALSLGAFFIAIITASSLDSKELFERAKDRNQLIVSYEAGEVQSTTKLFGNERTETILATSSIEFDAVFASSLNNPMNYAGTPLCSVDFTSHTIIGSFEYFRKAESLVNSATSSLTSTLSPIAPLATITQIPLPLNPAVLLTDLEIRDGIAYISGDSSTATDPDIFLVDIHDSSNAKLLSSINTGPGIVSLALAGKRIYAAAASTAGQLHIIRMDSLSNLTLETKFKLPLPHATTTPTLGSAIFHYQDKIYLGTEKWDGDEFNVIDVSIPAKPLKISSFEIGGKIDDIFVHDGIAYVASADQNQLRLIDVHDPAHPILLNLFGPSGWTRQEGKVVTIFEHALNLGRTSGGYDIPQDHEAFSWATTSLSTLVNPISLNIPGGVYGIVADRNHLYLATRQAGKELQIFDRRLNASTSVSYSLPTQPQVITCNGNKLYILSHSLPSIYEVTF